MLKYYSFNDKIKLLNDLIYTKLFYTKSRLIRRPFYVRGKKFIDFGYNLTTGVGCRIDAFSINNEICLKIGHDVQINDYVHIAAIKSVKIGNNVLIASKVFVTDHNHGYYGIENRHISPEVPPIKRELSFSPVSIEDDVWIGELVYKS